MRLRVEGEGPLDLGDDLLVGTGGEGALYARGDVAYKVYAGRPPSADRVRALRSLHVPRAALPDRLLFDENGQPVGFSMPFLRDHVPLARLCTRSFRDRHGVGTAQALTLARRLRDQLRALHAEGGLLVDLNELNVLVDPALRTTWLVDVGSWQLPGHPATAVMDHVRDRHAPPGTFDAGTDWFAFAVVTFLLLVGVHPYRGVHPTLPDLDARMRADASVLRPDVRVPPAACFPVDALPRRWRDWFEAVLEHRHRGPPPDGEDDAIPWLPVAEPPADGVRRTVLATADGPIRLAAVRGGVLVVVTDRSVLVDGRRTADPDGVEEIAFTRSGAPVLVGPTLRCARSGRETPCDLHADARTVIDGRPIVRCGGQLVEIELLELRTGGTLRPLAAPRVLAPVHPSGTTLYDGVVVQRIRGAVFVSAVADGHRPVRIPELDAVRIVDARGDQGVVVLSVLRQGAPEVAILRIARDRHDLRSVPCAAPSTELAVLRTGVAVRATGEGLELFRAAPGDPATRTVPAGSGGRLLADGDRLLAVQGDRVVHLALR